jgi:hypothetical protein
MLKIYLQNRGAEQKINRAIIEIEHKQQTEAEQKKQRLMLKKK